MANVIFQYDWQSRFLGPNAEDYPLHYYIEPGNFQVGVTRVDVFWQMFNGQYLDLDQDLVSLYRS